MSKLGFGVSVAEKTSVEVYSGRMSGASATYNITATNAVVSDGTTWNGSLTAIADASVDLIGVNLVRNDSINFENDNKIIYFGRVGIVEYELETALSVSGTGTVGGTVYSVSSPALTKFKKKGTALALGGGVSYNINDELKFSAGLDYMPNVGGGYITKSNITTLTFGINRKF
jgi:opacity protein-like surface antigen